MEETIITAGSVFNSAPETFIQNSFYLYIRNVTADLQVLKAVGEV